MPYKNKISFIMTTGLPQYNRTILSSHPILAFIRPAVIAHLNAPNETKTGLTALRYTLWAMILNLSPLVSHH
jgi:hypothetical protein